MTVVNKDETEPLILAIVGETATDLGLRTVMDFVNALGGRMALVRVLPGFRENPERTPTEAGLQADQEMREKAAFGDWVNASLRGEVWLETDVLRSQSEFAVTVALAAADWRANVIALVDATANEVASATELAHASNR